MGTKEPGFTVDLNTYCSEQSLAASICRGLKGSYVHVSDHRSCANVRHNYLLPAGKRGVSCLDLDQVTPLMMF